MKNFLVSLNYLFPAIVAIILVLLTPIPSAQLTTSENRILLQVQKLLEYPQVLQGWTNWTNFCYLPPSPSLKIVCSNGHVTELTIIGNKTETLSERFSIDSFFTVLTKLSNLKVLSLVSLGLWGPLPSKINRFWSLEVLNISSNFIYGEIPSSISSLKDLRSLVLADNLFNGSVPDLRRLASLRELNLGGNKLGPEFPSIDKYLVRIILKNNSLRCQIPPQLVQVDKLELFDISSNEIFGNIPSFVFSLPLLQYLNMAANKLTGSLSVNISCNSALSFVDISHNFLVGKLPSCFGSKSSNRTILYSGNCFSTRSLSDQHPSSYCKQLEVLAVKPPVRKKEEESHMQIGLLLGIIGGVVGIAGLLVLLILFNLRKSKAERADSNLDTSISDKFSVRAYPRPYIDERHVPQPMRLGALGFPSYRIFTSEEIEDTTNNFDPSNLIGEGSQDQLYKGWLIDGSMVIVNRVKLKQKSLSKNSIQNLKVLPYLRHRHLVSVLGHTVITYQDHPQTTSTIFIVFEHIPNVSLRDHLTDRRKKEMLKWPQRMTIITGIARGIQFLHTGVNPGIFGNNIKIENILLDDSLNAKVSGYSIPFTSKGGLDSTLKEQSAPNHNGTNDAEKEDIYQLGVTLLEIITGKIITSSSEVEELKNELERGLSEAASPTLRGSIDPSLRGTYVYESLRTAVQITINCLSKVPCNRPSIEDIHWNMQYSVQVQEASGNLNTKL
ncbi:probable LRR receptor-like serine/threonine-protein kinase At1g14390 [Gastrolobium bilobum]|uniref:probable LRR receptor-like serine/threonine-protein kinase At1g14390 n=1 Tax=Gastrolobium bilobum TaxID=150636 RepID=UPI002AB15DFD|nr:probable LRR receptor-like serine/threonine-protein kinase At1g14390 [Gastrolobium bilobum]